MTFVAGFALQRAGFRSDFSSTARGSSLEQQEVVEASTCSCQRHHQHQHNYDKTSSSDSKYSRNCKFSSQLRKHSPWYPSLNNSLCHSPYSRVSCISNRLHSNRAFSITHNSSLSHSTSPLQCLRLLWHLHRCRIF